MELASDLETEKHVSLEMSEKLNQAVMDLEETRSSVRLIA